jgi:hypothetical protein
MARNVRASGLLVARSIGFGVLSGMVLGVAGLGVLAMSPFDLWALPVFVIVAPFAVVIGGVVGGLVGLFCGVVLAVAGPEATGDRDKVRVIAGTAAGVPFLALALWQASQVGTTAWSEGGWLWWLVVTAMACMAAAAIGPHVVGGRADPVPLRHSCFRHCRLVGGVLPG